MKHIVALSGGKDSTAMALRLAEVEPRQYEFVCTPTGNELPTMQEHWEKLGQRLGSPIIAIPAPTLVQLIESQKALPNFFMRWCTRMIKIKPFETYIRKNVPCTVYIGIRADESGDREGVDYDRIEGVTRRFPMDEWGWNLGDVMGYLADKKQPIPERTDCAWCFFQTLYELYSLWKNYPAHYAEGERYEALTGHTFRSDKRDTWPASLAGLRKCFESGMVPKIRSKKRKTMCAVCAR